MSDLVITHLYPAEMNIYGDTGNVIALRRRLEWRGLKARVDLVGAGQDYDFSTADLVFAGGGQDRSQLVVADDLRARGPNLRDAVSAGVVFLTVCGTYQLFGRRFATHEGDEISGIGVFGAETVASNVRMIGNVVVESPFGRLVGFENHSGRTVLDPDQEPLGTVVKGYGNNDATKDEGAVVANCFGTYLHGSLLPKNPVLADELLLRALRRRHGDAISLDAIDDTVEMRAAESAAKRP